MIPSNTMTFADLIGCTFRSSVSGTEILRDGEVISISTKLSVEDLEMKLCQAERIENIINRRVVRGDTRWIALQPGDTITYSDNECGGDYKVIEDRENEVLVEYWITPTGTALLKKDRCKYLGAKCYQQKKWV